MASESPSILPGTSASIERAAAALRSGQLVAMPTETVYGLAGNARDAEAVARIFAAKGRPSFNPLIVHVSSLAEAEALGHVDAAAQRLAARFWPGPLTLVVRAREGNAIAELATAGLGTIALRVPAHPVARALIAASGLPLAAPAANKSGRLAPTCAADVAADFGSELACVLDGGAAQHGLESTVIDATTGDLVLLRPGAVTAVEIETVTGTPLTRSEHAPDRPSSPGQLLSHYAPRARVRLDADEVKSGEALLAFGPHPLETSGPAVNLSERGDLVEAAARLFASLRKLDAALASSDATIAVMPIPEQGLGEAINDRLRRAAAAR